MSAAAPIPPRPDKLAVLDAIVRQGFVPIFVNDSHDSMKLVEAAVAAGCEVIEYTCRRPDVGRMIPRIKREFPHLRVMAATLMDGPRVEAFLKQEREGFLTVDEAVDLGADALVSFMRFRPESYAAHGARCVMIPGIATQNEALDQLELGADLIKATVHTVSGRELVTKTAAVTHHCIPFFVSGGVGRENLGQFVQAGVVVAAAGMDVILSGDGAAEPSDFVRTAAAAIRRMLDAMRAEREAHQPELAAAAAAGARNLLSHGPWIYGGRLNNPAP